MNLQRGFKRITLLISITAFLISFLSGCTTPEIQTGLTDKESRMSEELLRSQVLRYKEEIEKDLSEMAKFFSQYGPPLDSPFTPEMSAAISTALAALAENKDTRETMINYSLSIDRYFLFYDKLKEKGGDMRGLELDFNTPIQDKHYSPPIEEPKDPTSETEIRESRVARAILGRVGCTHAVFIHKIPFVHPIHPSEISPNQNRHISPVGKIDDTSNTANLGFVSNFVLKISDFISKSRDEPKPVAPIIPVIP